MDRTVSKLMVVRKRFLPGSSQTHTDTQQSGDHVIDCNLTPVSVNADFAHLTRNLLVRRVTGLPASSSAGKPLKNVFEVADGRQKQAKNRSLCLINEHFEPVFDTTAATQIVSQRPARTPVKD
ncbi:hypothetical protein C8R34_10860 [Nitrosomonas sp. Nm84]|uniref:hypothetical protein n=1 Tax=Nitrosomonas sp. Nm84 TaxID=200124 RepID=UPI000D918D9A|nr:hypothetical protein [Nitrosomonas sp. Nm84]PXW88248.1 hypothetical protein C8R34_10860 [Nitrosomonas sp. Nm84]